MDIEHFCLAIDPEAFRTKGSFDSHLDALMGWMREAPPRDENKPVLVFGDPEHGTRKVRVLKGIPLSNVLVQELREVVDDVRASFILGD